MFLLKTVIIGTVVFLVGLPLYHYLESGVQPGLAAHLINLLVIGLFLWLWFGTYYQLHATHIHYRCGPFRVKIAIDAIRKVQRNTTMWSGFRPATARKGIIVKYNKYDEIYFSPDSNESFIQALLNVRTDIAVIGDLKRQNQSIENYGIILFESRRARIDPIRTGASHSGIVHPAWTEFLLWSFHLVLPLAFGLFEEVSIVFLLMP